MAALGNNGRVKRARYSRVPAKPGELRVAWGALWYDSRSPELIYSYQKPAEKADTNLLIWVFNHVEGQGFPEGLIKELENRGYDLATLKFSIQKKKPEASS